MKNLFLVLLVVVMVVGIILSGCAEKTPAPTSPTTTSPTTTSPTTASPTTASPTTASPTTAPPTEPSPKYGGTLRYIFPASPPPTIGWPPSMSRGPGAMLTQPCFETLLRGDNNGRLYPWLAESYQIADNKMSMTFNLRKGVKFHDGSDFNAEVAKWNLENLMKAKLAKSWESVEIIDDYAIKVNFTKWQNTLPYSFSEGAIPPYMISKAAFDKNGLDWVKVNPVGTGPFVYKSFTADVGLKFAKNPDYWVAGKPYLDAIEYIFIKEQTTAMMTMQTGGGDVGGTSSGFTADEYDALGFDITVFKGATVVILPDTANPNSPWADKRVRMAVEYAIDRESISKALGFGYTKATYQIPPHGSLAYNPDFKLARKYDPEKAKQLLAEAGYPDGLETTLILFPAANKDIMLAIQANLAQAGIDVKLTYSNWGKWGTYMGPGTWPENSALVSGIPRFEAFFLGGLNFLFKNFGQSWLRTPEATEAFNTALQPAKPDVSLIRECTDILSNDASVIPVYESLWFFVTAPYVVADFHERGYTNYWNTEDAWLDK